MNPDTKKDSRMSQSTVSVIIPTRNRHASVSSVVAHLRSSLPEAEVIVVDDASVPPVQLDDPAVHLIRLPECRGIAAARNIGVTHSQGEILVFLDDDVVLDIPGWQYLLSHLEEEKQWVCPSISLEAPCQSTPEGRILDVVHLPGTLQATRRQTFLEVNGFDEELTRMVDFDISFRAFNSGHRLIVDERAVAHHRDVIHTFPRKVKRLHEWLRLFPFIWHRHGKPVNMLALMGATFYYPSLFPPRRSLRIMAALLQPDFIWSQFERWLPQDEPQSALARRLYAIGAARGALKGFNELPPEARHQFVSDFRRSISAPMSNKTTAGGGVMISPNSEIPTN